MLGKVTNGLSSIRGPNLLDVSVVSRLLFRAHARHNRFQYPLLVSGKVLCAVLVLFSRRVLTLDCLTPGYIVAAQNLLFGVRQFHWFRLIVLSVQGGWLWSHHQ